MKIQFRADIVTHVPTCCLIEHYQILSEAISTGDWDSVATVMDCIAENIDRHTEVPADLTIRPSGSSLIAMGHQAGIILDSEGMDIKCAAGIPVSQALLGGTEQCREDCPHQGSCEQSRCVFSLEKGVLYHPNVDVGVLYQPNLQLNTLFGKTSSSHERSEEEAR